MGYRKSSRNVLIAINADHRQSGESLNITYDPDRDGPAPQDGNLTNCPALLQLNSSSPVNLLSTPYPAQVQSSISFAFPLDDKNKTVTPSIPDFTFVARGLGASGTVEIVGVDSPQSVISAGKEGNLTVEVIAEYSGVQNLDDIIKVCTLQRDSGIGIGIYVSRTT